MTGIYRDDIKGTRELFSAVLDNRLNNTMKWLTSVTLIIGGADRDLGAIWHERQPGQHAVCGQFVRVRHRVRADFGDLLCRGVGAAQKAYAVISNRARRGAALPFSVFLPFFSVTRADKYRLYR